MKLYATSVVCNHLLLYVLVCFVLFCTVLPSQAHIESEEADIVKMGTRRMINKIDEFGFGMQNRLKADNEVYLFYYTGASYNQVRVFARPTVNPKTLARMLDKALIETRFTSNPTEWEQTSDYSATQAEFSNAKFRSRYGSTVAPVGQVVAGIKRLGLRPYAILRIPGYATAPSLKLPVYQKRHTWYDITNAPSNLTVKVHAKPSTTNIVQSLVFAFFTPLMTILGLAAGILTGLCSRIPITTRRRLYPKIVLYTVFGSIALHIPFAFYFIQSSQSYIIADIWFGKSTAASSFIQYSMPAFLAMLLLLPVSMVIERKLFGSDEESPKPELEPEEKSAIKSASFLAFLPSIAGSILLFGGNIFTNPGSPYRDPLRIVGFLILACGPFITQRFIRKKLQPFQKESGDDQLTARAESIARQIGTQIKDVVIDDSSHGATYALAFMLAGKKLRVTRKMMEVFTDQEIDFILAHEIAHVSRRHLPKQMSIALVSAILITAPMILFLTGKSLPGAITWLFWLPIVGMFFIFVGSKWYSRQKEWEADRIALETTRNLEAAESALAKTIKHSPMPHAHEIHDFSTHPAMSKRIRALRKKAAEMGIGSSS